MNNLPPWAINLLAELPQIVAEMITAMISGSASAEDVDRFVGKLENSIMAYRRSAMNAKMSQMNEKNEK